MARAATIRACVESSPPEMPSTSFGDTRALEPFDQPLDLNIVGFIAAAIAHGGIRGYIREAIVFPFAEQSVHRGQCDREADGAELPQFFTVALHALGEAGLSHALLGETLQVQVGRDQLRGVREPFGLRDQGAVLVHHRLTIPGQICCGLSGSRGGVEIGG